MRMADVKIFGRSFFILKINSNGSAKKEGCRRKQKGEAKIYID